MKPPLLRLIGVLVIGMILGAAATLWIHHVPASKSRALQVVDSHSGYEVIKTATCTEDSAGTLYSSGTAVPNVGLIKVRAVFLTNIQLTGPAEVGTTYFDTDAPYAGLGSWNPTHFAIVVANNQPAVRTFVGCYVQAIYVSGKTPWATSRHSNL